MSFSLSFKSEVGKRIGFCILVLRDGDRAGGWGDVTTMLIQGSRVQDAGGEEGVRK